MANTDKPSKSMDVKKPGTTAPDSSSRPIIVSGRSVIQDPMVKEGDKKAEPDNEPVKAEEKPAETATPTKTAKKVISPITAPAEETQAAPAASTSPEATKSVNSADDDEKAKETAVVDAVVQAAGSNKSKNESVEVMDEKRRQEAQVLIDSKKYQVPIGQVSRAKNNKRITLFLFLILILGVAYVAADVGIIEAPFELPVKIFNNIF